MPTDTAEEQTVTDSDETSDESEIETLFEEDEIIQKESELEEEIPQE